MKLNKVPGQTFEGGKGFKRDPKTELFLRSTTSFAGEDRFYESGEDRNKRAVELARDVAVNDWKWFSDFLVWLRSDGNMRTAPLMLSVEGVRARLNAKPLGNVPGTLTNRELIAKVLQRPDEPKELVAYHINNYGKSIPKPIKRGVSDAMRRMMNERQVLRYDKDGEDVRLGDVVELCHVRPRYIGKGVTDPKQGALLEHLIANRHNRDGYEPPWDLESIRQRHEFNKLPAGDRHTFAKLVEAGDTDALEKWQKALAGQWEWGRSWLGQK